MKSKDVEIGGRYIAKISGKLTIVRILEERRTTWLALNEATGRKVDIRSAQRLRSRVE